MRILTILLRAALALLATLVLFLVAAFIVAPKIMGWVPLTVLTGSMRPHVPPGSEIVVDRIDSVAEVNALHVGDVISYMPYPDDPTLITHRIIDIAVRADGQRLITVQGDANPSPDPNPVLPQQIKGKLLYHVPGLGYLTNALPQSGKGVGLVVAAAGLIAYGAWQVFSALRGRRRTGRHRRGRQVADDSASCTAHRLDGQGSGSRSQRGSTADTELVGADR